MTVWVVVAGHETPLMQVAANGLLYVYFEYLKALPAFSGSEAREVLLDDINAITGAGLPRGMIDKWPSVKSDLLTRPDILDKFLNRLKQAIEVARS
jgi:hypothetical protein